MKDEIKELLEHIEILDNTDYILHSDKAKALLDYITNLQEENESLNNKNKELYDDLKTLWIVLWNMDTEMTGYQNEVFDKYYDEFYKGSDKE